MKQIKSQFLLLLLTLFITKSLSLHLNMIHRDSIYSPTYPGNLTAHDRLLRISDQAKARADYIDATLSHQPPSNSSTLSINAWSPIRPTPYSYLYLTDLTIGTPLLNPLITYRFALDTGSPLMWVQSQPCKQCFPQAAPIFNPATDSTTWKPLPCSHPLCARRRPGWRCQNNQCLYFIDYTSGSKTSGILATDRLGFSSNHGGPEFVNNLVFGCGYENLNFNKPRYNGILGLNLAQISLASQMGRRFSYCLSPFTSGTQPPDKLRFGNDANIPPGPNVITIPFVKLPIPEHYYLPLIDISIAGKRLGFPPGTFAVKPVDNKLEGGFIIDSGSSVMMFMKKGPYKTIIDGFVNHFNTYNLVRAPPKGSLEVCYMRKEGFSSYPTVTFHFENNKDLFVNGDHVVVIPKQGNEFCVAMAGMENSNLFGAAQQVDYKFSFDLVNGVLSYVPTDCSRNG